MTAAIADAVVIGGGFYGLRIALFLRETLGMQNVVVLEREPEAMSRASYVNQARVHNGYHYPRSILTAYRSRVNFPEFVAEYADAIVDDFEHVYAISSRLSKVNARQFELFSARIGAPLEPAGEEVASLFDPRMVAGVYLATEPAFDARILRSIVLERIRAVGGIEVRTSCEAIAVRQAGGDTGADAVVVSTPEGELTARLVVSAVYSRINTLHAASGLDRLRLQHEVTEMPLVRLPSPLDGLAFTVMDGPFFSMMPFPDRGAHTLSHVRFTPHRRWIDDTHQDDPHELLAEHSKASRFAPMRADVARFMPGLRLEQVDSLFEVKTVLARSESDDSRPIVFRPHHGIRNYTCIMGAKLDTIYDVLQELAILYGR